MAGGSLFLYVHQPVLRLEENAFLRGEVGGPTQPALIESNGSTRELRAGAGWSTAIGLLRIGAAAEWTRREDLYEVMETSGSPDMGFRHVDFEGDGFGAQAGLRWGEDVPEAGTFIVGAQARWIPELSVEGQQEFILLSGDSTAVIQGERESGFEGGLSASWRPTDALQLLGGVGGRTAAAWTGFGVEAGTAVSGAIGLEFHDVRDPWTVRIGFGLERQEDVPEDRATTLGLGLSWSLGGAVLDLGLVHRSITRDPEPTSYEDRLAITLSGGF
jgi:hypothetical protein